MYTCIIITNFPFSNVCNGYVCKCVHTSRQSGGPGSLLVLHQLSAVPSGLPSPPVLIVSPARHWRKRYARKLTCQWGLYVCGSRIRDARRRRIACGRMDGIWWQHSRTHCPPLYVTSNTTACALYACMHTADSFTEHPVLHASYTMSKIYSMQHTQWGPALSTWHTYVTHSNIESSISSQVGPILFNPYLPHSSMLSGVPRMDGIAHESLYCNQPYTALTATSPRHLQYATPVPQYSCPTSAPPMSLPSTAHALYYNMSHVPGGSFPISRCSLNEDGTVGPASPYSVVSVMHVPL